MQAIGNHYNDGVLEEINFKNLVFFYFKELRQIQEGVPVGNILHPRERTKLKDSGIIDYQFEETWITKKALKVMDEIEKQSIS